MSRESLSDTVRTSWASRPGSVPPGAAGGCEDKSRIPNGVLGRKRCTKAAMAAMVVRETHSRHGVPGEQYAASRATLRLASTVHPSYNQFGFVRKEGQKYPGGDGEKVKITTVGREWADSQRANWPGVLQPRQRKDPLWRDCHLTEVCPSGPSCMSPERRATAGQSGRCRLSESSTRQRAVQGQQANYEDVPGGRQCREPMSGRPAVRDSRKSCLQAASERGIQGQLCRAARTA